MLDWGHKIMLRSVANHAPTRSSPALDNLVATGLVRETETGHEITPAGEIALAAGKVTRMERIAWPVAAVCLVIVAIASTIELFS